MTTESIIAIIASLGALITAIWTSRSSATKDEVESLRKTIVSLQDENERLQKRIADLETRNEEQDIDAKKLVAEKLLLRGEVERLEKKITELECENAKLKERIAELEKKGAE